MDPCESLNEVDLESSLDWREQEQQIALYKAPRVKDLFPTNYAQEKQTFFESNQEYDPHFLYKTIVSPDPLLLHTDHQELAYKILQSNVFKGQEGLKLNQEEVLDTIQKYLDGLGLADYVKVKFEANCLSRTSVAIFKDRIQLKIRVPLDYTKTSLEGVLHHEIGTHIIRALNHKDNCLRKPSQKAKVIEQGLAAINQSLSEERPFLFKAALRYMSAIYSSKMSFRQLYKALSKHLKQADDCWRECVRVKRGISNTDEVGGYYKDQNYLVGAVEILQSRHEIDFRKIYYGRVTPAQSAKFSSGVLPPFLDSQEKYKHYLKKLDGVAICNFIH